MEQIFSMLIGYLIGSVNPAAIISVLKKRDLRKEGTCNLGATNTTLIFGKKMGAVVLVCDMAKSSLACFISRILFPASVISVMISGIGAILGHIFPFYFKFKGGKGLAAFAGFVLFFDPLIFLILLIICTAIMFIVNYSVGMPVSAAVLFTFFVFLKTNSFSQTVCAGLAGIIILISHQGIFKRIKAKEECKIREMIKQIF